MAKSTPTHRRFNEVGTDRSARDHAPRTRETLETEPARRLRKLGRAPRHHTRWGAKSRRFKVKHLDTEEIMALIPMLELLGGVVGLGPLDEAVGADHRGPERVPVVRKVASDSDNLLLCLRVRWGARISLKLRVPEHARARFPATHAHTHSHTLELRAPKVRGFEVVDPWLRSSDRRGRAWARRTRQTEHKHHERIQARRTSTPARRASEEARLGRPRVSRFGQLSVMDVGGDAPRACACVRARARACVRARGAANRGWQRWWWFSFTS